MTEVPSASPSAACYLEELHLVLHSSDGDSAFIPDVAAWYIAIGRLIEEHIAHQHLIPPARYMVATQRDHERRSTVGHGQAYKHHDCTGGTGRPSVQDRDRPLCACQFSGRHPEDRSDPDRSSGELLQLHPGERKSPSERRSCRQRRSPSSVGHMVSNVEATGLDLSIPKRLGAESTGPPAANRGAERPLRSSWNSDRPQRGEMGISQAKEMKLLYHTISTTPKKKGPSAPAQRKRTKVI